MINPSIGLVGVAVQKDRDTAAAEPSFVHGLTGGSPFGVTRSIESTPVSCGNRAPADARVSAIEVSPSVETLAFPDIMGLYAYAALGKVETSVVSEGSQYKHVITMGDALPYLTLWSQVGKDNFTRADGCKLSTLTISATGNEHVAISASFMGIGAEVGIKGIPGSVPASCYDGKYTTTDCTFKIDAASSVPTEALVADCQFTFTNGTSAHTSLGRATPRDISDGNLSAGVTVTTIPDDITQYKKMVTGSQDATSISGKVVMGSVYAKFVHTEKPEWYIEVEMKHVPFTAEYPSVDPEGAEGTIQFTCDKAIATTAKESPVTVTVVNGTKGYGSGVAPRVAAAKAAKGPKAGA